MTAYYNENNPCAAQWLRNLIDAGLIAHGDVDERSITDVRADDLTRYTQAHFFAGIGGWSYALRLAGWPDDQQIWTGSAPCQPFSVAGRKRGEADERHLWPEFARLIRERNPAIVIGEQVASNDGREWLAGIRADMETMGYAVGAADLCAASAGAPHIRQRLYWGSVRLENSVGKGLQGFSRAGDGGDESKREPPRQNGGSPAETGVSVAEGVAYPGCIISRPAISGSCDKRGLCGVHGVRPDPGYRHGDDGESPERFWDIYGIVRFPDGAVRRTKPGVYPVGYGVSARVGRDCTGAEGEARPNRRAIIEGFGNAIVPQLGAEFVKAFIESITEE